MVHVLNGVRVIDLTTGVAGPVAGQILADFGADVIKVEAPGGDPSRALPGFAAWNRGKKGIVVDPGEADQLARLVALVETADVLLTGGEETLPGWGLDPDDLSDTNPRLVIAHVPPYAGKAPWPSGVESNGLLAAALGIAARQSSYDGSPIEPASWHLLHIQGLWAATAVSACLLERERSGFGQVTVVDGTHAVLVANTGQLGLYPDAPQPDTAITPAGRHPTYTRHLAGDGRWLASGALGGKFEHALLRILGLESILDDERMGGSITGLVFPRNRDWLFGLVSEKFLTRPRDEWLRLMAQAGIPCGPIDDRADWLDHEVVRANGLRAEVEDPEHGHVVMPGVLASLSRTPGRVAGAAPSLGQHQDEVQPREPVERPEGKAPVNAGPLAGFQVLDTGTFVAAPFAGMLFAELGADVIKVEQIGGDPFRATAFTINRGMRSISVDLKSELGAAAFRDIVRDADVLIGSLRPGVAETLGLAYHQLAEINPDIIVTWLSAFGSQGPMSRLPGVDMVVQGMSGMMSAQGGEHEPVVNTIAIVDVGAAAMLVLSSVLALIHRERTGEGQAVDVALVGSATFLQTGDLVRYEGRPAPAAGGRDFKGNDPFDRLYRTADGWIRLRAFTPPTADALAEAGIAVGADFATAPAAALGEALAGVPSRRAVKALHAIGIDAVQTRTLGDVVRDPDRLRAEFVHPRLDDTGRVFVAPGRYAEFGRTARSGPLITHGNGEHTVEILQAVGWTSDRVQEAAEAGAVEIGGPMRQGLPLSYR